MYLRAALMDKTVGSLSAAFLIIEYPISLAATLPVGFRGTIVGPLGCRCGLGMLECHSWPVKLIWCIINARGVW